MLPIDDPAPPFPNRNAITTIFAANPPGWLS
jgi:hypothetical protein